MPGGERHAAGSFARRPAVWLLALLPVHALGLALAPAGAVEVVYGQALFPVVARVHAALDATPLSPGVTIVVALLAYIVAGGVRAVRTTPRAASSLPGPVVAAAAAPPAAGGAGRFCRAAAWRLVLVAAALAHAFSPSWGLNYRRPSVGERLGLLPGPAPTTAAPVTAVGDATRERDARSSAAALGRTADRVVRATNAARVRWGDPDLVALERAVDDAVQRTLRDLGLAEAAVPGRRVRLLPRRLMAVGGWAGVTLPWTTEAMIDPAIDPRSVPHCMAHEKAHQAGFAREADANFVAWLALVRSDDPRLRYSTLFFVVDLFVDDSQVPLEPDVLADAREAVAIQEAVQVPAVRRASERVYDTYLRANEVQAGIADYDGVAGLIHAWLQRHPETLPD
ncbi:MAG: DUF3810 domain-containing protein [Planctomycetes bacterium]|nr:DUF3810 domain-containing protein [Planctomycetota bacterium]